jgi:hypothetical protein
MRLSVDVTCVDCGHVIKSAYLEAPSGTAKVEGTFTLAMQPPHVCSRRYSVLQKNDLQVTMTNPSPVKSE